MAHYLITGCSGAGKSTLLEELARRGHTVVREPGRRAIARGVAPWEDCPAFLEETERLARADLALADSAAGPVFFDRGLLDAVLAAERLGLGQAEERLAGLRPYTATVFFAPPWPELFRADEARRHDFPAASEEAVHLRRRLPELGYMLITLPQLEAGPRADFVLSNLLG